jgi:hypothetical protein
MAHSTRICTTGSLWVHGTALVIMILNETKKKEAMQHLEHRDQLIGTEELTKRTERREWTVQRTELVI